MKSKYRVKFIINFISYLRVWLIIKIKQLNSLILSKDTRYTKFVILCEGRTGSTLLHTYLNSHFNIHSYGDIFNRCTDEKDLLGQIVFHSHSKNIKAVGFKLFYNYQVLPQFQELFQQILEDKDIKIIHLTRANSLKVFTSLKIAEKTGKWSHESNKAKIELKQVDLDIEDTLKFVNSYEEKQPMLNRLFEDHDLLNVSYDNLVDQTRTTLNKVQRFLEVSPKNLISVLERQNPESLSTLISNYKEIKEHLPDKYF